MYYVLCKHYKVCITFKLVLLNRINIPFSCFSHCSTLSFLTKISFVKYFHWLMLWNFSLLTFPNVRLESCCGFPLKQSTTDIGNKQFPFLLHCWRSLQPLPAYPFLLLSGENQPKTVLIYPVLIFKGLLSVVWFFSFLKGDALTLEASLQLLPRHCWVGRKDYFILLQALFLLMSNFPLQVIFHKSMIMLTRVPACDMIPHESFPVKLRFSQPWA